jgi:transposase
MKRKHFSKQFKLEALQLLKHSEKSGAELARELGIRRNQLYKWQSELLRLGEEKAFNGPWANASKSNVSELTALKQRVAQLEEENAILKKAEAYFTRKHR